MDLLGEVLLSVRIDAHSVGVFHAGDDWGFFLPQTEASLAIAYSVIDSPCWMLRDGHPPRLLQEGDSVLVMHGSPIAFASAPTVACISFIDFWRRQGLPDLNAASRRSAPVRFGFEGSNRKPHLLTIAYMLREPRRNPLLADLPDCVLLPGSAGGLLPWLPAILQLLSAEELSHNPGYLATATHLAELVLTSFLRAYALSDPAPGAGWLRGLVDARIGKALVAIHARPAQDWTVATLAIESGMSRATFARRFRQLVGTSPFEYLIAWRMQLAAQLVVEGRLSVAAIIEKIGYTSETAFRKAFKEQYGMAPRRYAKVERNRPPAPCDVSTVCVARAQ
jgi:AraC-like DNA-binding protein